MNIKIRSKENLTGEYHVPGDKSISHRAVMFGSIAEGTTEIEGFLLGEDCLATIDCFRKLGIQIEQDKDKVTVHGKGLWGLQKPQNTLDVGNSGTAIRLISGILAGQPFDCDVTGDESIQNRPMDRVASPLSLMGAEIYGKGSKVFAPLHIKGKTLDGIEYTLPVASAQVKSAILLASLYAKSRTIIIEKQKTRNHTEIMLNSFGANIINVGNNIISTPVEQLHGKKITIPSDISSAAFLIVAAAILPESHITVKDVGINDTRTGIITALREMGADIQLLNRRDYNGEPVCDIEVRSSQLKAITLQGSIIPKMIDEIPVFAVASLFAEGTTVIKDASELKVKESNRIKAMVTELSKLGATVQETEDGMIIEGGKPIKGALVDSHNDHRVAMSLAVAALKAEGETEITNSECIDISFPGFFDYFL